MNSSLPAVLALNQRYFLDYPHEAARQLESLPPQEIAELLAGQPPHAVVRVWQLLAPNVAGAALEGVAETLARHLMSESEPAASVTVLAQFERADRDRLLGMLEPQVADELRGMLEYPEDSAGRLMDPSVTSIRSDLSIVEALGRLRAVKSRGLRELFVVDEEMRLIGRVEIQESRYGGARTGIARDHPPAHRRGDGSRPARRRC